MCSSIVTIISHYGLGFVHVMQLFQKIRDTSPSYVCNDNFSKLSIMAVRTLRSHFRRARFQRCNVGTLVRQPTHRRCHGQA